VISAITAIILAMVGDDDDGGGELGDCSVLKSGG